MFLLLLLFVAHTSFVEARGLDIPDISHVVNFELPLVGPPGGEVAEKGLTRLII